MVVESLLPQQLQRLLSVGAEAREGSQTRTTAKFSRLRTSSPSCATMPRHRAASRPIGVAKVSKSRSTQAYPRLSDRTINAFAIHDQSCSAARRAICDNEASSTVSCQNAGSSSAKNSGKSWALRLTVEQRSWHAARRCRGVAVETACRRKACENRDSRSSGT